MRKRFVISLRKLLFNKRTLFFLNGFMLSTMLYLYMEDSYEKNLFEAIASYIKGQRHSDNAEKEILLNSLHVTYGLGEHREGVFSATRFYSVKSSLFHPVTYDLMTANGACGSYAFILSRLLTELHIPNRIGQMEVKGKYGGHILLEAQTLHGWAVLDPLYNLYFTRPDGNLASFADVHNNWNYYSKQVPAGYDTAYSYEGVRYTNWQKIPVLMPLFKKVLIFFCGKKTVESLSLRVVFLREFHILLLVTGVLYLLLLVSTIRKYLQFPPLRLKSLLSFAADNKIISKR